MDDTDKTEPVWSPDGKYIAYQSNGYGDNDIYTISVQDRTIQRLTEEDSQDTQASWLKNGKGLVFVSDRDGDFEVFSLNIDTRAVTQLNEQRLL